jgi:hypothetical protein
MPNVSLKINFKDGDKLFAKELNNNFNVIKEAFKDLSSVTILGSYETEEELKAAHPTGEADDGYLVGSDFYTWLNDNWVNVGPLGPKGDTGNPGAAGPSNVLTIGTVTSGAVADAAIVGDSPNQVLNLVLPQGPQGERGPQGSQGEQGQIGPQGNPGPANTLSIGTVEAGSTASATIEGESPTQTLNLVLPKGDKGDTGATGPQGEPGSTGDTLPIGAIVEYDGTTVPTGYEKVSDGNFSNIYSTDERVIGKWINGKPLYEKTITFTDFERTGGDTYKEHNIPNVDLAFINFSKSFGTQPSGETVLGNYAYNTVYAFQINGVNKNAILYSVGSSIAMSSITVTLDYTKTTD